MVDQKTTFLFETPPAAKELARRNDPEESKKAAREIAPHIGTLQKQVLELVKKNPDWTQAELTASVFVHQEGYRDSRRIGRRLPELAALGKVYKSGSRPCRVTGRTAATWKATT